MQQSLENPIHDQCVCHTLWCKHAYTYTYIMQALINTSPVWYQPSWSFSCMEWKSGNESLTFISQALIGLYVIKFSVEAGWKQIEIKCVNIDCILCDLPAEVLSVAVFPCDELRMSYMALLDVKVIC